MLEFTRFWRAAACASALVAASCAAAPAGLAPIEDPAPQLAEDGMPLGPLSGAVRPTRYAVDLRVDPTQTTFSGQTTIDVVLEEPADHIWMHGYDLTVTEAELMLPGGKTIPATYAQKSDTGSALLTLPETVPAGEAKLHFVYTAPFNDTSYGMLRQERGGKWYAVTQFEPIAARWVFPGFDEPRFKVPFDVAVTAPASDVVVTNAPEVSRAAAGRGWTRHVFAPTKPLPTYLVAFVVGPYDVAQAAPIPPDALRDAPVPLGAIAVKGLGGKLGFALGNAGGIVQAHEDYFGTRYPYDKLDLVAMPSIGGFGAMENAGAITFDEFLLVLDEDAPLAQRRSSVNVNAHELAHMWVGDLVTPVWWTDIWLNESFAEWASFKASEAVWPEGAFEREVQAEALGAMSADSLASARQIRQPVLRDAEIGDSFDGITYEKGAGVLAMLESYVGEDAFREGVRLHMRRFAYANATAQDFMESLAEGSGNADVIPAFRSFILQPGVPILAAKLECPKGGAPRVSVRQSRYAPLGSTIDPDAQLWQIPTCVSYTVDGAAKRSCALVSKREQTIALDAPHCPDAVVPNADGKGYYRFALDEAGWSALTAHAAELPATEALAAVDSLDAAFRSGAASADAYVAGLEALARHPAWDVVDAAAGRLGAATALLDEAQLDAARPRFSALFHDRYAALAAKPKDELSAGELLLLRRLTRVLALAAKDPEVRGAMTTQAARKIGIKGERDWSYIDPDLRGVTLAVGVEDLGPRFFDLLLGDVIASNDPALRRDGLAALAAAEDPALAARLRDAAASGELRGGEALNVLSVQLAREKTREATWKWIEANSGRTIELASETFRSQAIPQLGASFCSAQESADFTAWIEANAAALPGYERTLAQTQEQIALCTALKAAAKDDLAAALAK